MIKARLTKEQAEKLIQSWRIFSSGSQEKRLIEDIFVLTGTPAPFATDAR